MLEVDRGREGTGRDTKLANEHSDEGARLARNHRRHSPGPAGQAQELQGSEQLSAAHDLRAVREADGRERDGLALPAHNGLSGNQLQDGLQHQTARQDHIRDGLANEGARPQGSDATRAKGVRIFFFTILFFTFIQPTFSKIIKMGTICRY